jgi:hypothetical protein
VGRVKHKNGFQLFDKCPVSIQLVSPASGEILLTQTLTIFGCFHSISFPSKWGAPSWFDSRRFLSVSVSIQLVSPASGKGRTKCGQPSPGCRSDRVSIQLVSPARGENNYSERRPGRRLSFHSISFPSE